MCYDNQTYTLSSDDVVTVTVPQKLIVEPFWHMLGKFVFVFDVYIKPTILWNIFRKKKKKKTKTFSGIARYNVVLHQQFHILLYHSIHWLFAIKKHAFIKQWRLKQLLLSSSWMNKYTIYFLWPYFKICTTFITFTW